MTASESLNFPQVPLSGLTANSVILCATQRLAKTLSRSHDEAAGQQQAWQSLQATTVNLWLGNLHAALDLRGLLPPALSGLRVLNSFQEKLIWEGVIKEALDTRLEPLFDLSALAARASQAHRLSIQWNIPVNPSSGATEEQAHFQLWQQDFQARCQTQQLIDTTRMQAYLIDHLPAIPRSLLQPQVVFAGFDHYTILEQRLQQQLAAAGINLVTLAQSSHKSCISRVAPIDLDDECQSIALWAQSHLRENPGVRLGVVVPELAAYQYPLQDALEDRLSTMPLISHHAKPERPFNISLGQALSATPMVQTALTLLDILANYRDIEQSVFAHLLHSPYWSDASTEADSRARLDVAYRASVALKAPLRRYVDFADWLLTEQQLLAPNLRQHLAHLLRTSARLGGERSPAEWRAQIESALVACGWLHALPLNSLEFQTRQAFQETLEELGRLEHISSKLSLCGAVTLIRQLCQETLFQPKTQGTPPIQILGMLESTGLSFDALWIAGLTENSWPPVARPNPLLSISAQRAQNAPNACARVQLSFAQQIQARLFRSAPEITVSAPAREGEALIQPSALIADLPLTPLPETPPLAWIQSVLSRDPAMLTCIEDTFAPPVEEGQRVRGGTWLLRAQAVCPAWGYYEFRLGAKALQTPCEGLDARQRGTLVHHAMEAFWKKTQDLKTLQQLVLSGLKGAVDEAVDFALTEFNADKRHEPLKPRQHILEQQRLRRLMIAWLGIEAQRQDAFTVLHTEHEFKECIGGIEVRMFIDRIDQRNDGRILIVDYKTGANIDTKNWAQARLTEPQLPIYAAIAQPPGGHVAGVAFAQLHLAKLGFKGIGEALETPLGIEDLQSDKARRLFDSTRFPDWASLLNHWRQAIYAVAAEVCRGDAGVRFANDKDLRYCDVKPLLRLAERANLLKQPSAVVESRDA
jgi:probable DNA repair protein